MRKMRWKVQHVARRTHPLDAIHDVQHLAALDERHLLVLMRVHGSDHSRLNLEPADHQLLADHHLPLNAFRHLL